MYFGSTLAKQLLMRAPTFDIGTIPKNIDGIEHRLFFYKSCLDSERLDAFFLICFFHFLFFSYSIWIILFKI